MTFKLTHDEYVTVRILVSDHAQNLKERIDKEYEPSIREVMTQHLQLTQELAAKMKAQASKKP